MSDHKPPAKPATALRQRDLIMIHTGKKQLGMDDDVYRSMLWMVARVRSSKDLDVAGRQKVIAHLKSLGAVYKRKRVTPPKSKRLLADKVIAMMLALEYSDAYVDGMAQKMFGIERWEWLELEDLNKLMVALAIHQKRKAKDTDKPGQPDAGNQ